MKRISKLLILCLTLGLLCCGCGNTADSEPDYSSLIVPPVDLSITDCITEQQLTTVMGCQMTLLGTYEDGVQAVYMSEDGSSQVTVHMMNQTRAVFDSNVTASETPMTVQEGLGAAAFWDEGHNQILVYYDGYAIDVAVTCTDSTMVETYTRQIAEMLVSALQHQQ